MNFRLVILMLLLLVGFGGLSGCNILGFGGAMIETYRRSSTRPVEAEYDGLYGYNYAVIVTGDRVLQGSYPTLFSKFTSRITERLYQHNTLIGATGFVPPIAVLQFQLENPNWVAWGYERLMDELEVDRLIVVEMYDYRLNEEGNSYLWEGVAAARVGVVEGDSGGVADFSFMKDIRVGYPDKPGFGPTDIPENQVQAALDHRFLDRVTWLFYEHEEPYYPDY